MKVGKRWKASIAVLGAAVFMISLEIQPSMIMRAADTVVSSVTSKNIHQEDYYEGNEYWASNVKSYLFRNQDADITRVEVINSSIVVETYDSKTFVLKSSRTLQMELPLFGGFYAGADYNYLVFGQENNNQDNSREVIRIVQYNKNWERVRNASLSGANTVLPFDHGSLRFCEAGDIIYVRTSHKMYRSEDGNNNQANLTFAYNEKTGEITSSFSGVGNLEEHGYVSHSFNQFVQTDGDHLFAVDHGDTNPRSIVLSKYNAPVSEGKLGAVSSVDICGFGGDKGDNYTGASVGGFEISNNKCLVAYQSVNQASNFEGKVRNIYLGKVSRTNFMQDAVENMQITFFPYDGKNSASNPFLVKVSSSSFVLMWEEYDLSQKDKGMNTLRYIKLDGDGNLQGAVRAVQGHLSDCQPIYVNNRIVWYVTDSSEPKFYALDLNGNTIENATPIPSTVPSGSPAVGSSGGPAARPTPIPTPIPLPTPRPTPKPITTPRPTATPYPPYDETAPDDSDLVNDDEVGADNPSLEEINQIATEEHEKEQNSGNQGGTSVDAPIKGTHISNSAAEYVVTSSGSTPATVRYYRPRKSASSITVPATVTIGGITYNVTSVAAGAFKNDTKMTSVTIGKNVTNIGMQAMSGCKKLKNITIKTSGLTSGSLGSGVFTGVPKSAVVKVPSGKVSAYKKIFRNKGLNKNIKVKQI